MAQTVSVQLPDSQVAELGRLGRRLGRSPSEMAAMLLDEALRVSAFSSIVFRDSPVGRQAYVQGTSLAVWEVMLVARSYGGDAVATARHLDWPVARVQAALNYADAFAEEILPALEENAAQDFAALARQMPQTERFSDDDDRNPLTLTSSAPSSP